MALITANARLLKILTASALILLITPLLIHRYLALFTLETAPHSTPPTAATTFTDQILIQLQSLEQSHSADLKYRILELSRIKNSVSMELNKLESRRRQLQLEINNYSKKLEEYKSESSRRRSELERLNLSLEQGRVAEREAMERLTPRLGRPRPLGGIKSRDTLVAEGTEEECGMDTCFDYSLCPVSNPFAVYIYPTTNHIYNVAVKNVYTTVNPYKACIYLVIVTECSMNMGDLEHWHGDGRNHLIITECSLNGTKRAILHSSFSRHRKNFDIHPPLIPRQQPERIQNSERLLQLPAFSPARRKYMATYLGPKSDLEEDLIKMQGEDPSSFVFQFTCGRRPSQPNSKLINLCSNRELRTRLLGDSTFVLILESTDFLERVYESLEQGSIPIVVGSLWERLPYNELIDWRRAGIYLPTARVVELHYMLKYYTDADIVELRKGGRSLYLNYFNSIESVVDGVFNLLRSRVGIPPLPFHDIHLPSVFNSTFTPLLLEQLSLEPEDEESLGPIEPPHPSPHFARNYSTINMDSYANWNGRRMPPFLMPPSTPWDPLLPSEAKFMGSSVGFRPVNGGKGGAGKEFSESLGGNLPKEQFTIVMLTYEREQVLINSLSRLYLLPYLNKVIVIWNSENPPSPLLKWPDIGVPIVIKKSLNNSLNNRFLPFREIETEALLSLDDDAHLRHDEIVFGFRVWRENRDRIVGFPGRFHAWDGNWFYNSNYSCELSMVLTGAAFHHRIYSYLYSYSMSSLVRSKVDELFNCEDIAMNFLVSHVTGKPPVKVTSRWTFRCPGCPVTLSEDESHFQERHTCIQYFTRVYGYNPLLYTQFRADSVLFKTRIPHDRQKCFKYI